MNNFTLFDTSFAKARSLTTMAQTAVPFIIKNGPLVVLNDIRDLEAVRVFSSTPLSKLFQDITNAGKLSNFTFLNLSRFNKDIPEILALDDIVIDAKTIPTTPVPAQLQKCWINITPITSVKDSYNGSLNISDAAAFASMIVRAAIVQSYNDSVTAWLNPRLATIVIENYAMTISHVLRQAFTLGFEEEKFVQTLFAAYFAQLLGDKNAPLKVPPMLMRCTFLGSAADILGRLEQIEQYRENGGEDILHPIKICGILAACGPERMKKFVPTMLYRFLSSSSLDSQTMMIAVDYPAYWVFQMLRVASGYKNPIMSNVIKLNTQMKTKINGFAQELQSSNQILSKLNRG